MNKKSDNFKKMIKDLDNILSTTDESEIDKKIFNFVNSYGNDEEPNDFTKIVNQHLEIKETENKVNKNSLTVSGIPNPKSMFHNLSNKIKKLKNIDLSKENLKKEMNDMKKTIQLNLIKTKFILKNDIKETKKGILSLTDKNLLKLETLKQSKDFSLSLFSRLLLPPPIDDVFEDFIDEKISKMLEKKGIDFDELLNTKNDNQSQKTKEFLSQEFSEISDEMEKNTQKVNNNSLVTNGLKNTKSMFNGLVEKIQSLKNINLSKENIKTMLKKSKKRCSLNLIKTEYMLKNGTKEELFHYLSKNFIKKVTFKQLRNILILSVIGGLATKSALPIDDILLVLINQIYLSLQTKNNTGIEHIKKINTKISKQYQLLKKNKQISNNNQKINNENNLNSVLMGAMAQAL